MRIVRRYIRLGSRQYFLLLCLMASFTVISCSGRPSPRHLVLICIDTVRADAFFSNHIHDVLSAHLSTAQQYRNVSAPAPWTIPSVASALTGLYPIQHNAGRFQQQPASLKSNVPGVLSDSARTLAELLREQQFITGAFSAHPWISARFGFDQGFGQFESHSGWRNLGAKFGEWMDRKPSRQRFFAYLHLMEAHDWHVGKRTERNARLAGVNSEVGAQLLADASGAACAQVSDEICQRNLTYNLAIREVRVAISHILQQLEERGLLQSTLVIVYSDHGEEFREHKAEHQRHDDPRNVQGFGHGHSMYQELLHVPLLVWHPGIPGAVRQELVSLVDIVPSALRWLGVGYKGEPLSGLMLPAGQEPARSAENPRVVFASGIAYGSEQIMVREGHLKSILYYPDLDSEYFDLAKDPVEKQPLQNDLLTMRFDALTGDYQEMKKDMFTAGPGLDPKTLERLQSIGYLQGIGEQNTSNSSNAEGLESDGSSFESTEVFGETDKQEPR